MVHLPQTTWLTKVRIFEQEFTLSLVENDEETLQRIADALDRIELGAYGACEQCERKIPKQRLNVLPFTAYCVKCASEIQAGEPYE